MPSEKDREAAKDAFSGATVLHEWQKADVFMIVAAAIEKARDLGRLDGVLMLASAQVGTIIDITTDKPIVRRVLGRLPVTADGCVIGCGPGSGAWKNGPDGATSFECADGWQEGRYSTREAAEAARERFSGGPCDNPMCECADMKQAARERGGEDGPRG